MNELSRIYQGRIHDLDLATDDNDKPWQTVDRKLVEAQGRGAPLWCHHEVFQAAANYYMMALAAMVDPNGDGLLVTFRKQVENCWNSVPHRQGEGFQSLKKSVSRYLDLNPNATCDEAFERILRENDTSKEILNAAVTGLAEQLLRGKGGANVQQLGRGELPKFCNPQCTANFANDPLLLKRAYHQKLLPWTLYHADSVSPGSPLLNQFDVYSIATPNKEKPLKEGIEVKQLFGAAVAELRKQFPEFADEFEGLETQINELDENQLSIPNYIGSAAKGVVKLRLYALLLFKYVHKDSFTLKLLKETHGEPSETEPEVVEIDEKAVDPLETARGERGYVFCSFTALPIWKPDQEGAPTWTEFDIAAFKEALKTLNQFRQKTEERTKLRGRSENLKRWIEEADEDALRNSVDRDSGKEAADSEEGESHFTFCGDKRIDLIRNLTAEMHTRQEEVLPPLDKMICNDDSPKTGGYRILFGTLRGVFDLREEWQRIFRESNGAPEEEKLREAVRDKQRSDRYGIGSAPLFFRLCEKEYWDLWRELSPDEESQRSINNWSKSPLHGWAQYGNICEEIERLGEPIQFTPAEPRRSRRLSMLSDFAGRSKTVFGNEAEKGMFVECSLAVEEEGQLKEKRARLYYSAQRMRRDGILMTEDKRSWLQPMVNAFGFRLPEESMLKKDPAVALMPQLGRLKGEETVKMLLNFPIQIDPAWLVEQIAKERWSTTTKEGRELEIASQWLGRTNFNNHIHWEGVRGTFKKSKGKGFPDRAFHEDPDIVKNGFSVLAFDLGQRDAGGYALLETRCDNEPYFRNRQPIHTIGIDEGGREWKTAAVDLGLFRLPGEDAKMYRPKSRADKDNHPGKQFRTEFHGGAGRNSNEAEWKDARAIAARLGIRNENQLSEWLGRTAVTHSYPEQNDKLILIFRRAQSRLATWQRWSWKLKDPDFSDSGLDEIVNTFSKSEDLSLDAAEIGWSKLAEEGDADQLSDLIIKAVTDLKQCLRTEIVNMANRILPLRGRSWVLKDRGDDGGHIELVPDGDGPVRRIRGQRGLSISRISQLEEFRKRILSLNRSIGHVPGVRPKFGKRGLAPEPCREILDRLDRLKEQRINQVAHLILAKALGVQLKPPSDDTKARAESDLHGEYERIPGRKPVDLIVIEDLNRYTSSQGRSRRENSALMRWCHRSVRDKLVELCEPFGISVLEVQPAYSSRFDGRTGHAGFRAEEVAPLPNDHFLRKKVSENIVRARTNGSVPSDNDQNFLWIYELLEQVQGALEKSGKRQNKHTRTLIVPREGGPLFVSAKPGDGSGIQADVNAAVNLGLSAIAKHDNLKILRKIRSEKNKRGEFRPRHTAGNLREKATFTASSVIEPVAASGFDENFLKQQRPNFFVDTGLLTNFDRVSIPGIDENIVSGRALLGYVKAHKWQRCWEINFDRIRKNQWLGDVEIRQWEEKTGTGEL
ncbi:MAG: type V CRISPR-associated protein Cas12b [Verrucomicrobiales bacterium]|nr:type V CRISPR-associated protein Cas12b [Verrucomicrobiales bacterium]